MESVMAYSLETLSGFESFLQAQGYDNRSTNEIMSYLASQGFTTQIATDFETGANPPGFDPFAQVDIATNGTVNFSPTGAAQLLLDIADSHISVTGSRNVAVAPNTGDNVINLDSSTGNDTVFLGTGNNTVDTGFGSDVVHGGTGNESYFEGTGSQDDTFYAGTGNNLYVDISSSSNAFHGAGLEGNDSVDLKNTGGGTTDLVTLGNGHNTVDASSSADNLAIDQGGTGSATVTLGSGHDSVDFATNNGAGVANVLDSVTAGSGPDTIDFVGASLSQAHLYYSAGGVTVTFGGQLVPNSAGTGYVPDSSNPPVQTVSISAAPGSDVTLEFTDGHLKG
jgi:hypothetical protein